MTDEKGHQMADHEDADMEPSEEMTPEAVALRAQVSAADILTIVERNAKRDQRVRTFVALIAVLTACAVVGMVWFAIDASRQNRAVLDEVNELVEYDQENIDAHRIANQANHDCIIDLILDVVDRASRDDFFGLESPCPPPPKVEPSADEPGE